MSSNRWKARQEKDPYVKQARAAGYRARAAFKLLELDEKDRLLRPGFRVVDLGAAPGSWSQVAAERVGEAGRVVALDILPMDTLPGVDFIEGDFRESEVLEKLESVVGDRVDLVLSDMAPNLSGIPVSDQARSMHLAELALDFARQWLSANGRFVVKLFQGEGFDEFVRDARATFKAVRVRKPNSSRRESREVYLIGDGLKSG
jgi:23S rRNA (uridine2552-2'-O)-methyltransferase